MRRNGKIIILILVIGLLLWLLPSIVITIAAFADPDGSIKFFNDIQEKIEGWLAEYEQQEDQKVIEEGSKLVKTQDDKAVYYTDKGSGYTCVIRDDAKILKDLEMVAYRSANLLKYGNIVIHTYNSSDDEYEYTYQVYEEYFDTDTSGIIIEINSEYIDDTDYQKGNLLVYGNIEKDMNHNLMGSENVRWDILKGAESITTPDDYINYVVARISEYTDGSKYEYNAEPGSINLAGVIMMFVLGISIASVGVFTYALLQYSKARNDVAGVTNHFRIPYEINDNDINFRITHKF